MRITVALVPHRSRYRAATSPSPPLYPFPHTTTARRPYVLPMTAAASRATARPAFSMRLSTVTPRARLSRSSSALSAGVRMGSIRFVALGSPPRASPSAPYRHTEGGGRPALVGQGHHDVRDAE